MKQFSDTFDPSTKELRSFASLQLIFFSIVSAILYRRGYGVEVTAGIMMVSFIIGISGWFRPSWIRFIYIGWMVAVFPIGWTVSHLLMAIVYYFVVTPIGLWRTKFVGDSLQRQFEPEKESYWEERNTDFNQESYFRQF